MIYRQVFLYKTLMRLLYGRGFEARYQAIACNIPPFSQVVDICCGDCEIYNYLKPKHVSYLGIDISVPFEKAALKSGMVNLEQAGIIKALKGETSLDEVYRVAKRMEEY